MVGKTGFEPATSWSQTTRTAKLCYFPIYKLFILKSGALGGNRTPNLLVRSQTLYPIELRVHNYFFIKKVVAPDRIELSTPGFSVLCSTN